MPKNSQLRAALHVNPGGYGFAQSLDGEQERGIFIPPGHLRGALDGDEIEVVYWESEKGLEGRIEEILVRKRTRVVGLLTRAGQRRWVLEVDDPRLIWPVTCIGGPGPGEPGKVVVAEIVNYPEGPRPELGVRVKRTVGEPGALETEVQSILIDHRIDDSFSEAVLGEARAVPTEVRESDLEGRADLRGLAFMTIDPPDARDFDDAVCVELLSEDRDNPVYRLHVAVADVSHYVREGTAIDDEAQVRCFSTYLPDRSIPMLPQELSSHMCSLVPKEDRLAMIVSMRVDARGQTSEHIVRAGVIHSRRRLSYGDAAETLDGAENLGKKVRVRVFALRDCADRLRRARMKRGALELNLAEAKVVLEDDDRSRILDVVKSRSSESMTRAYNLIEEMMIAANEAVGALAVEHKLPAVYRVHDKPDPDKLGLLGQAAGVLGIKVDPERLSSPLGAQKFLKRVAEKQSATALNMLMLRAMSQAHYSTKNLGHFALASSAYSHFTSPIRRYADLISHRVLKAWVASKGGEGGPKDAVPRMPKRTESEGLAVRSSEREREVSGAERETQNLFAALFMRDRIGDRFEGSISGLSQNGIFVQLDSPFVDGMVRVGDIEKARGEPYNRDETGVRTVGERSGKVITIGDRVLVEVVDVSVPRRQIDLVLVEVLGAATGRS